MESCSDNSLLNSTLATEPTHTDVPTPTENEHDETLLVSVVYIGAETWVTDFDKLGVSRKIMERLSMIEAPAIQDPVLDDICAGKDPTDGRWYRVKVVSLQPAVTVHYIDFGNECEISPGDLGVLPDELKREPPLAKRAILKWENPCSPEVVPIAGDVLEVKYDGKEADGTLKFEVVAIKGIPDEDEGLSDEETTEEHLSSVGRQEAHTLHDTDQEKNGCLAMTEDGNEFESPVEQIPDVEAASNLREEAHSAVQDILNQFYQSGCKELPKRDEVAIQTRLEVEKTMKEIDSRFPLQEEVALQTRLEVQKMMEGLDERLQKQQEAALASMRQMMEKALSQSLHKIDRIQKDLHKLYATSKQNQQRNPSSSSEGERSEGTHQKNHYNRPITRNVNVPTHEFSPDKRSAVNLLHHGGNVHGGPSLASTLPSTLLSPRLERRDWRTLRDPNAVPYGQIATQDQAGNARRSVSLRLKQAADYNIVSSTILFVNNLPEVFTCDYLCTLFGLYGNVLRAKLLFNQKGRALVEMDDALQAATTMKMLDGSNLFGQTIHVRPSNFDKLNISLTEIANNMAKDYTRLNSSQANSVRRFKKGFYDASRLVPPSDTLRVFNILKSDPDEKVKAAFTSKGFEIKSIHFHHGSLDKKTAFVVFPSTEEAFQALHELHNFQLSDWMTMKINFGVSKSKEN